MRRSPLRESRLVQVAVGASMLAIPASAAALTDTPHPATAVPGPDGLSQSPPATVRAKVKSRRIGYDRDVVLSGTEPSSQAGQAVALQFAPSGTSSWREVATAIVRSDGQFRLSAALTRSGSVEVTAGAPSPAFTTGPAGAPAGSASERVRVEAAIRTRPRDVDVLGDKTFTVRGRLLPGAPGRKVRLDVLRGGRWQTLASARTGARGAFDLRASTTSAGREPLRVRFAGDRANAGTARGVGMLTTYRQTVASWYYDGGNTACGFHAYYGVANVSLPCGTKVAFRNGSRRVTAVVDDRGPYVGGREWDLNQNTAAALGFGGVGSVWSSE